MTEEKQINKKEKFLVSNSDMKIIKKILWTPLLVVLILIVVLCKNPLSVFIEILKYRNKGLEVTPEDFPKFSETIYYLICTYTVIISGIFSYLLYKATARSVEVSEESQMLLNKSNELSQQNVEISLRIEKYQAKEKEEKIHDSAFSIYYDLKLAFEKTQFMLIEYSLKNYSLVPGTCEWNKRDTQLKNLKILKKIFINNDWQTDLRVIRKRLDEINGLYIKDIYIIYSHLEEVIGEIAKEDSVHKVINLLPKNIFNDYFVKTYDDFIYNIYNYDELSKLYYQDKYSARENKRLMDEIYETGEKKKELKQEIENYKGQFCLNQYWQGLLDELYKISEE